ncbi:hypothetical protein HJFPF1_12569 [Paramyrothecium foliicola]|nr:hypothetical protein HJFPF1_12569 [Paramyrothecium foliicola]
MAAHWYILRLIAAFEDRIVATILKQPGFHRAVGRIHRTIHEKQYGRNPHDPLAPGEATEKTVLTRYCAADPNSPKRSQSFFRHFLDELKNQFRGKPTELPNEPRKK